SLGVPAGARMIDQFDSSKPATVSAIGGISGNSASRAAELQPRARRVPPLNKGIEGAAAANISDTRPATMSTTAGAVPLYGIWRSSMPVLALSNSGKGCRDG